MARPLAVWDGIASARQFMADHPSSEGWHKVESRGCGGGHRCTIPGSGRMVLWRRSREYIDLSTGEILDVAADPPLWVAEQVSTALCVTERWVWRIRHAMPIVVDHIGTPWSVVGDDLRLGAVVVLTVANGRWVWELTGDRDRCCGGYVARWAD